MSSASAEVAAHALANGREIPGLFVEQRQAGQNLSGRAIATLQRVMTNESGLQPMQIVQCPDALDRGDRPAVIGCRKRKTGFNAASVCQHGACSACSHIAAFFGAGHAKPVPENIQQRFTAWHRDFVIPTVYLERNMDGRTRRHEVSLKWSGRTLIKAHPRLSEVRPGWQGERRRPCPHSLIIAGCARPRKG